MQETFFDNHQRIPPETFSLPKNDSEVSLLDTSSIIRYMDELQMGSRGEFSGVSLKEQQVTFNLLSAEFKKRVENYQVPEKFMEAARILTTHPKGETEAEYKTKLDSWISLSSSDPRYRIAAVFNSAELPINLHNRDELIASARELFKRSFRFQAGLNELRSDRV